MVFGYHPLYKEPLTISDPISNIQMSVSLFLSFHVELRENFHSRFSPTKSTVLHKSQRWNQQHTFSFYSEVKCHIWNAWQFKLNSSIQLCLNLPHTKALSSLSLHTVTTCLGLMTSPPATCSHYYQWSFNQIPGGLPRLGFPWCR